jgi:hypothetical protein
MSSDARLNLCSHVICSFVLDLKLQIRNVV